MTDASPFWFQVRGGDVLQSTGALNCSALGCWLLLRIHLLGSPRLPRDKRSLQIICRGAPWPDVLSAVALLAVDDEGYKFDEEIERLKCKMKATTKKRSAAGKKGANSRWASKSRSAKSEPTLL